MSSDKTAGQWVGTIVGAVIGAYAGGNAYQGALIGASLGGTVGGLIDPPKGPTIYGPRLNDLSVQNAQYGSPLARIYGSVGVSGTVIWVENNKIKETIKKKKQGGKGGGGGSTVKTYSYTGTFAVALGDAPPEGIAGIGRVWVGSDLIYNAGSTDLETIIASNSVGSIDTSSLLSGSGSPSITSQRFRFYSGADDQMPDPRIEAEMGVGNAPAFRGTAYIVFYDLPLEKYGNSLMGAQVKVELISSPEMGTQVLRQVSIPVTGDVDRAGCSTPMDLSAVSYAVSEAPGSGSGEAGKLKRISTGSTATSVIARPSYVPDSRAVYVLNGVSNQNKYWLTHDMTVGGDRFVWSDSGAVELIARVATKILDLSDTGVYLAHEVWGGFSKRLQILEQTEAGYSLGDYITLDGDAVAGSGYVCMLKKTGSTTLEVAVYDSDLLAIKTFSVSHPNDTLNADACIIIGGKIYLRRFIDSNNISIREIDIEQESATGNYTITADGIGVSGYRYSMGYANGVFSYSLLNLGDESVDIFYFSINSVSSSSVLLSDVVESELVRSGLIDSADINVSDLSSDLVRGYRPAGVQQVRACIGPLQLAYPFDLIMDGYQIKAVRRGAHSSVSTIPAEYLDARPYGDAPGIQFDQQREMDSQLPRQVVLRHIDAEREYEVNEQRSAERMSAQSVDVREIDLALVLTPDEAAQISDVEMTRNWLERAPASFRLPATYIHLQPADIVTIETDYGSFEMLLGEISYTPDGRLECSAKPNAAASYTSPAVGGQGPVPDGDISLSGAAELALMDIPLIRNEDDEPGFAAAMAGDTAGWAGGGLFRSNDNEQTWADVQAWNAPVTMGYARDAIPQHDGLVIDRMNTLTVDLSAGDLDSITEAQMMTGLNWAAYGADGRWELIRFADADLQPDGSYVLSTLLRGLRGSEWATGVHEYGDRFVLLDDADVMAIGADIASLNVVRQWRGISVGQTIDDVSSIDFAYKGENLRPLSGVNGSADLSGADWVISWSPRTRLQGSLWKTGIALPVGETTESYQIDILDGSNVVRTLTSVTPTVTYTEAQQIEDFGSGQSSINCLIYQISASVGRGRELEIAA